MTTPRQGSLRSAARFTSLGRGATIAIRYAVLLHVVRILDPVAMGIFEAALVVGGVLDLLVDFGLGQAVIQRKKLSRGFVSTMFWLQFGISAALWAVLTFLSAPIASLLGSRDAAPLLQIIAWGFPLLALGAIHSRLLMRDLRFGGVALGELACSLGYGVVVFGFLKEHPEPELLAWAIVVSYGARTVVWWIAQREWHPSFIFRMKYVREVSSFSLNLLGASVGTFLLQRLDNILILFFAGESALGIYGLAKRLILRPARMLAPLVAGVLMPALARIQDDLQGMRRLYSRGLGGSVITLFPCIVGIALVVPWLMALNGKPEWAGVRWVVVALLPYALLFTVLSSVGSIFVSLNKTDLMLRVNLGSSAACLAVQAVLGFAFRDRGGAEIGTILATGSSVTMLLLAPWALRTALNLIGMSLGDALRPLVSTMLATLGMAGAVLGVHALLGPGVDPKLALTADVIIGALSYGALVWWLRPPALADLLGFVGMKKRASVSGSE